MLTDFDNYFTADFAANVWQSCN